MIEDKLIKGDIVITLLATEKDFENCRFVSCDLSEKDISGINFSNCEFSSCNLSMVRMNKTSFHTVVFNDCKMLGLFFDQCNPFGLTFSFNNCILNDSSFYKTKLKGVGFRNCQLIETDFTQTDLSSGSFSGSNLAGAHFEQSNLEKCDFRTAIHYSINPTINRIKKASFSKEDIHGLLSCFDLSIE